MKTYKNTANIIYKKLKEEISNAKCRFILLGSMLRCAEALSIDMPTYLQSPEGQATFKSIIHRLLSEEIISPVGNKPNALNGLYKKYRIINIEKKHNDLIGQIVKSIEPPASVDYYIKNPHDFLIDKDVIEIISDFLKSEVRKVVTVNERAYELFDDEKFFKGNDKQRSRGETVLKRLALDYESIACEETPEPFFSFQKKDFFLRTSRNIYIIENKDTFWSFKKQLMDFPSDLNIDMLIYGEGKKILSSFKFVDEYDIKPEKDTFYYFGDLDAEGINIYCELKDAYNQYKIVPFHQGYHDILEIGLSKKLIKTPKSQRINKININRFSQEFDMGVGIKIQQLLKDGYYVPQEALSAAKLKERFGL